MTRSRLWTVGTAAVVAAVLVVGWFLLISPKRTTAADLKSTAADTEAQNVSLEADIRQLKLDQKQLPAQRAQIDAIKRQMPASPEQPALIRQLTTNADAADVDLSSITPAPMQPVAGTPGVSFMPVALTVSGTFTNVKAYLDALEDNKRAIMVTGFTVAPQEDDPDLLSMSINARVFVTTGAAAGATGTATGSNAGSTSVGSSTVPQTAASTAASANASTSTSTSAPSN